MPFVRIDTIAGQYDAGQRAAISDVLYDAMRGFGVAKDDRGQTERPGGEHEFRFEHGGDAAAESDSEGEFGRRAFNPACDE